MFWGRLSTLACCLAMLDKSGPLSPGCLVPLPWRHMVGAGRVPYPGQPVTASGCVRQDRPRPHPAMAVGPWASGDQGQRVVLLPGGVWQPAGCVLVGYVAGSLAGGLFVSGLPHSPGGWSLQVIQGLRKQSVT